MQVSQLDQIVFIGWKVGEAKMSDREKVINDQQRQIEELEERLAIVLEGQPEIVRCKDCKHRGNSKKCVLAAISEKKDFPLFMLDNRGDWFCADGKRK